MGTQFGVDLVFKAVGGDKLGRELKKIDTAASRVSRNVSEKVQRGFARAGEAVQPFVSKVQRGFRKINASVERTKRNLKGFGGTLAGLGAGFVGKKVVGDAAGFGQTQVRLKALSEEYGEFNDIQRAVAENTKLFNQSQREAAAAFADSYARLRPFGIELEEIDTIYKGFNATAIANGASAEAASNAFLQLSQALGAGALQGDEFRSIAEQVPGLLGLVSDEMGVTVGQLKKLGAEGKITADVLLNSLAKGFQKNKDLIQKIIDESPEQQFKKFSNSVSDLSDAVGTELLPVVIPLADTATELVNVFGRLPGPMKTITSLAFGMATAFAAAQTAANLLGIKLGVIIAVGAKIALVAAPIIGLGLAFQETKDRKKEFDDVMASDSLNVVTGQIDTLKGRAESLRQTLELTKNANPYRGQIGDVQRLQKELLEVEDQLIELIKRRELIIDVVVNVPYPDFDKMGSGFSDELARELEKLGYDYTPGKEVKPLKGKGGGRSGGRSAADILKDQMEAGKDISKDLTRQIELREAETDLDRELLQIEYDRLDAIDRINKSAAEGQKAQLIELANANALSAATQARADAWEQMMTEFESAQEEFNSFFQQEMELNEELTETQKLLQGAGDIIANQLASGIQGLINGTKDWGDVLSSILSQLGGMFIRAGIGGIGTPGTAGSGSGILGAIFNGKAKGGPINSGMPYLVGEQGPEIVVPSTGGTVIPNDYFSAARDALSGGGSGGADGDSGGLYGAASSSPYASTSQGQAAAFAAAAAAMNTTRETRESTKMMEFAEAEKLALANPAPIDIKYDSRVINSETYVTEAQFQKGLSQSAKQARAMTISDLRNKPASRKRAGVS